MTDADGLDTRCCRASKSARASASRLFRFASSAARRCFLAAKAAPTSPFCFAGRSDLHQSPPYTHSPADPHFPDAMSPVTVGFSITDKRSRTSTSAHRSKLLLHGTISLPNSTAKSVTTSETFYPLAKGDNISVASSVNRQHRATSRNVALPAQTRPVVHERERYLYRTNVRLVTIRESNADARTRGYVANMASHTMNSAKMTMPRMSGIRT